MGMGEKIVAALAVLAVLTLVIAGWLQHMI